MKAALLIAAGKATELRKYIKEKPDRYYAEQEHDISPPLHLAATLNQTPCLRILLEHGTNPNVTAKADGMTPLMAAVWNQTEEAVRLLLNYGADPNIIDKDKWTALFHAAHHGNKKLIDLLLAFGADPLLCDIYTKTPSDKAKEAGHLQISSNLSQQRQRFSVTDAFTYIKENKSDHLEDWLLENNEINIGDANGNGLLHVCAQIGNIEAAEMVISYGANINRQNYQGNTPLHIAVKNNKPELVQFILQQSACWRFTRNHQGHRPMDESTNEIIRKIFSNSVHINNSKAPAESDWYSWIIDLYNTIHIPESNLLKMAIDAGLLAKFSIQEAKQKLEEGKTPEAIGLALALDYFKITKFTNSPTRFLLNSENSTNLGKYITACSTFDSGKKAVARDLLLKLVSDGFSPACVTVAAISIDNTQKFTLYKLGAENENRKAILELSKCYYYGIGTPKNLINCIHYYKKAGQLGVIEPEFSRLVYEAMVETAVPGGQFEKLKAVGKDSALQTQEPEKVETKLFDKSCILKLKIIRLTNKAYLAKAIREDSSFTKVEVIIDNACPSLKIGSTYLARFKKLGYSGPKQTLRFLEFVNEQAYIESKKPKTRAYTLVKEIEQTPSVKDIVNDSNLKYSNTFPLDKDNSCQGRSKLPQNRRYKIPQKDLSVLLFSCTHLFLLKPVTVTFQVKDPGMMQKPIQHRGSYDGISNHFSPFSKSFV